VPTSAIASSNVILLWWSNLRCAEVVSANFVLCDQSIKVTKKQSEQASRVLFKHRGKAKFYLSKEKKSRKVSIYTGRISKRLGPEGSLSRGFYKDFISCLEGSWLYLCFIGLFMRCMPSPTNVFHGDTVHAPLSLSKGP
jgi:hypothetical protein